jgi:hypothetical protein
MLSEAQRGAAEEWNYLTRLNKHRFGRRLRWGRVRARGAIRAPRTCDLCHSECAVLWSGKRGVCEECAPALWDPLNVDLGDRLFDRCADHPALTELVQWDGSGLPGAPRDQTRDTPGFYKIRVMVAQLLLEAMADLKGRSGAMLKRADRAATMKWFLDDDWNAHVTLERTCDILLLPIDRVRVWARAVIAEQQDLELDPNVVRVQQRMLSDEKELARQAKRDAREAERAQRWAKKQAEQAEWDALDKTIYCIICRFNYGFLGRAGWAAHDRGHKRQGDNIRPLYAPVATQATNGCSYISATPPDPPPQPAIRAEWKPIFKGRDHSVYRPVLTGSGLLEPDQEGWLWEFPCQGCGTLLRILSSRETEPEPRWRNKRCHGCALDNPVMVDFRQGDPLLYLAKTFLKETEVHE